MFVSCTSKSGSIVPLKIRRSIVRLSLRLGHSKKKWFSNNLLKKHGADKLSSKKKNLKLEQVGISICSDFSYCFTFYLDKMQRILFNK